MSLDAQNASDVYEAARTLLPAARSFSKKRGLDPALAEDFLMEAAYNVVNRKLQDKVKIENLPAYLFTAFKRVVLEEIRKKQRYADLTGEQFESISDQQAAVAKIEREILKEEIARHLHAEARFIFDRVVLGYSYKEISSMFSDEFGSRIQENVLRSKFSKALQRLAKELRV